MLSNIKDLSNIKTVNIFLSYAWKINTIILSFKRLNILTLYLTFILPLCSALLKNTNKMSI